MVGRVDIKINKIESSLKFVTVKRNSSNLFMDLMLSGFVAEMNSIGLNTSPNIYEDERGFLFEITVGDDIIRDKIACYCNQKNI